MLLRTWRAALAVFILAALTGVLFRYALMTGRTGGLSLVNVRHAHSHLMFFGWVTPALVALVAARLPALTGRPAPRGLGAVLVGLFATALPAWVLFGMYGYEPTAIGAANVPLSTIASTLAMFVWYGFVAIYARWTWGIARGPALLRLDAAVFMLAACTLGAWGLAALVPFAMEGTLLGEAAKHAFLDLFTHGWLLLGVLGFARAAQARRKGPGTVPWMMLGMPGLVGLSLPPSELPGAVLVGAGVLSGIFGLALLVEVVDLIRYASGRWMGPLAAAGLVAGGVVAASVRIDLGLASQAGLRLLYLHLLLLGAVSLGLVATARDAWGRAARLHPGWMGLAAGAVVASLVPMTPLWPASWAGPWVLSAALWAAVVPPLVVVAGLAGRAPGCGGDGTCGVGEMARSSGSGGG